MDKDGMYVVHDVVDDYPDLASFAVGDLDERHVVVYRRGFQPEGTYFQYVEKDEINSIKFFCLHFLYQVSSKSN